MFCMEGFYFENVFELVYTVLCVFIENVQHKWSRQNWDGKKKKTEIKNWQYSRCCCVVAETAERNRTAMWRMAAESLVSAINTSESPWAGSWSWRCWQGSGVYVHVRVCKQVRTTVTWSVPIQCWYQILVRYQPKCSFGLYQTNSDINAPMKKNVKNTLKDKLSLCFFHFHLKGKMSGENVCIPPFDCAVAHGHMNANYHLIKELSAHSESKKSVRNCKV